MTWRGKAVTVIGLVVVAAAGLGTARLLGRTTAAGASSQDPSGRTDRPSRTKETTTVPPAPLEVTASSPASGATGVDGAQPVVFHTTGTVDVASLSATMSPAVPGRWSSTPDQLVFTPTGAYPPSSKVTITVPAGTRDSNGGDLSRGVTVSFTTASGSVLRLQQLLAELGYLPLKWTPAAGATAGAQQSSPAAERAVYSPPTGSFAWAWASPPASLVAQWSQGSYTVMVKGAVMAFESDNHLSVDGIAGPQVWHELLTLTAGGSAPPSTHGYTYALASKTLPETLTVWHNGTVISSSRANTGIPAAPTADGTFPVYERLATQIMRGTNPNGSKYADPVAWVAYFNGGDAIHYIGRASYGYPQSLGCVEVPYNVGATVWPYLGIGTLVTVTG